MQLSRFFLAITLVALMTGCSNYYDGPESDHFDGSRFFLPGKPKDRSFTDFLKWQWTRERGAWPEHVDNAFDGKPEGRVEGEALKVWFVGHAGFLIQTHGLNILTDPVYAQRSSPFTWTGPKRVRKPGVAFDNLPPIDVVVVSHNHYDHLDTATLKRLWDRDKPRIVVPLGNDTVIHGDHSDIRVETLDWGQSLNLPDSILLHLEPSQHWSARGMFDTNKALWGAFIIDTPGGKIYFAGDSGYGDGGLFRKAATKYGGFRLAILPIGAYQPRWFMGYAHMNPQEALMTYRDLNATYAVASHFGMFPLADDGFDDPLNDLAAARKNVDFATDGFRALDVGESWDIP